MNGTAWDPATNEIYVNLIQGKELREAIRETTINVIGEKGATMYLSTSLDAATGLGLFNATAGANLTLTGKNIKVVGDDPSVGITLTDGEGTETRIKDLPRPRLARCWRLYAHHHDAVQRRLPTEDTKIRLPDH